MNREFARFGRFNLIGIAGAAMQLTLFALLMRWFRLPEVAAAAIAVEVVVLNNFFWHERFTWADRSCPAPTEKMFRLARFHAANGVVSLVGNTALVWLLVQVFRAPALFSAVAGIAVCAPVNFLVADRWVYRKGRVRRAPESVADPVGQKLNALRSNGLRGSSESPP